jgi:PIN domain nuclease of toxin-antitoxin system
MTILDASAVIALLRAEPCGYQVRDILSQRRSAALLTVNRVEVVRVLLRQGVPRSRLTGALMDLEDAGVEQVPLDAATADLAGELRAANYRKRNSPLSLPDCCALAYAKRQGGTLVTSDTDLGATAVTEDVQVVVLTGVPDRAPEGS